MNRCVLIVICSPTRICVAKGRNHFLSTQGSFLQILVFLPLAMVHPEAWLIEKNSSVSDPVSRAKASPDPVRGTFPWWKLNQLRTVNPTVVSCIPLETDLGAVLTLYQTPELGGAQYFPVSLPAILLLCFSSPLEPTQISIS